MHLTCKVPPISVFLSNKTYQQPLEACLVKYLHGGKKVLPPASGYEFRIHKKFPRKGREDETSEQEAAKSKKPSPFSACKVALRFGLILAV